MVAKQPVCQHFSKAVWNPLKGRVFLYNFIIKVHELKSFQLGIHNGG